MAASAPTTCAALADGARRTPLPPRRWPLAPPRVSLPALPAPAPLNAVSYCRKIARNIVLMAGGESIVTGDSVATTTVQEESLSTEGSVETGETTSTFGSTEIEEPKADLTTSEPTTELPADIVKRIQDAWDRLEDKYEVSALAFAGFVLLWGSAGMISAIDKLPIVPGVFELVGIGFTGWFAYRNLIFKPERETFLAKIKSTYESITGSSI